MILKNINNQYQIYGYEFKSEIPHNYLLENHQLRSKKISVYLGSVVTHFDSYEFNSEQIKISHNKVLILIPNTANYLITSLPNETSIVVDPYTSNEPREYLAYLMGSILGSVLHYQNELAYHAAAIKIDMSTVLVTGDSGAGKSTTQGALLQKGANLVADDVAVIRFENNKYSVASGHPNIRLWADSAKVLGYPIEEQHRIRPNEDKYWIPVPDKFIYESQEPTHFVILKMHNESELKTTELRGAEKVKAMMEQLYTKRFIAIHNAFGEYYQRCIQFAKTVKVLQIERPETGFFHNEITDIIQDFVKS